MLKVRSVASRLGNPTIVDAVFSPNPAKGIAMLLRLQIVLGPGGHCCRPIADL